MTTVREALSAATRQLVEAGVEDAEREAGWLLAHVMDLSAGALRLRAGERLLPALWESFMQLVRRRAAREPIQYILGTEEFMGMAFQVTPAVLIPRFDTETLVRSAAAHLSGPVRVADIGTGSGAVAIGLASLLPDAQLVAVDISPAALAVAQANARTNGFGERIQFVQGDLVAPLTGRAFDAILSNPPYIGDAEWRGLAPEVQQYEPRLALSPGDDDLTFYRRLAEEAVPLLKPGGFLAVEVGYQQAEPVAALFATAGLAVSRYRDTAGIERVVLGRTAL